MRAMWVIGLGLVGCGDPPDEPGDPTGDPGPVRPGPVIEPIPNQGPPPDPETTVVARTALAPLGVPTPVGVTIDADDGARYVVDAWAGLYRVGATAELVAGPDVLLDADNGDQRPYTDVAAMGGGRFGVSVPRDGLLFDVGTNRAWQYFCYEPGYYYGYSWQEDVTYQTTDALAYDPLANELVANPQTIDQNVITRSDIARFDADDGAPLAFDLLGDPNWRAGALAIHGDGALLARGSLVYRHVYGEMVPAPLFDLATFRVVRIDGLAIDPDTGNLVVLDGDDAELVEIADWDLLEAAE